MRKDLMCKRVCGIDAEEYSRVRVYRTRTYSCPGGPLGSTQETLDAFAGGLVNTPGHLVNQVVFFEAF